MTTSEQKRQARKEATIAANPPRMLSVTIEVMGRNCEECGMLFAPIRKDHVYCSHKCGNRVAARVTLKRKMKGDLK